MLDKGIDPRVHRRRARTAAAAEYTFEAVFKRWRDFKAMSLED